MRPRTLLSGFLLLFLLNAAARTEGITAQNWTLRTPEGKSVELAKISSDKPQIILFWATWCPYCKALMPHIQSIQMEYGDAIGVLAVNIKEDGDPIAYMKKGSYDFTLLLEGDAVADQYEIIGTPGVILVDTSQRIRFDLRNIPQLELDNDGNELSHRQSAQRLAPYWAAALRKALDRI